MSHPNPQRVTAEIHCGPIGAMFSLIRQKATQQVENIPPSLKKDLNEDEKLMNENGDNGVEDESSWLAASARLKDQFAETYNLKAIDGGFNSVIEAIQGSRIDSWVLIRGIADYQQGSSRLGRQWQVYI